MMKGFRIPAFLQAILVIVIAFSIFKFAIPPLLPTTLLVQYMIITIIGVLLYFAFDDKRWAEFKKPIAATLRDDNKGPIRWFFLLAIPALVGYTTYGMVKPSNDAPLELRQVHPAPPASVKVFNKSYNLSTLENPLRQEVLKLLASDEDAGWEKYKDAVAGGRDIYYQNCFYCHGDLLDGDGMFAKGFNPLPINFQDVGTIAQLQESFLFWRITTGGPGLPKGGTPWNSAMPVWHEMLEEDDVWQVITFLYDYIGQVPRIWDPEVSKAVTGMKDTITSKRASMNGKELYQFRCEVCHGEDGAGDGVAAELMYPKPRDFSLGLFKYKTSPGSLLPRDEDLINTIKHGLQNTGMPGWSSLLSDEQIISLVPVIKRFDVTQAWPPEETEDEDYDDDGFYLKDDFQVITEGEPVEGQVPYSDESLVTGKKAFIKSCKECHGQDGRGNITSGKKLEDDWGNRIWPRDLTKPWTWRSTEALAGVKAENAKDVTIKNIYTRLSIGIPGTPMPAHRAVEEGNKDPISLEDRWHIANYVYSLRETTVQPRSGAVVTASKVEGALPSSVNDESWDSMPAATLQLVPNIIKEERLFTPLNDAVTVRAVYNKTDIAFLLEIDDRTESRPGIKYFTELQDENLEMHADAASIQFPAFGAYSTAPVEKPLYRHGDAKHKTTLWYWNAGSVEPAVDESSMLLDGSGPNKPLQPRVDDKSLKVVSEWKDGQWRIMMTRPRTSKGSDISFDEGQFIPISFANWDGSNGEAGSKHTLSTWYWLVLPPELDLMKVYGLPLGIMFLVFLAGFTLVSSQRRAA